VHCQGFSKTLQGHTLETDKKKRPWLYTDTGEGLWRVNPAVRQKAFPFQGIQKERREERGKI